MVALDGSLAAERSLGYAELVAGATDAGIVLAHVPVQAEVESVAMESYLDRVAGALASRGVGATIVTGGRDPGASLPELALEAEQDSSSLPPMAEEGCSASSSAVWPRPSFGPRLRRSCWCR